MDSKHTFDVPNTTYERKEDPQTLESFTICLKRIHWTGVIFDSLHRDYSERPSVVITLIGDPLNSGRTHWSDPLPRSFGHKPKEICNTVRGKWKRLKRGTEKRHYLEPVLMSIYDSEHLGGWFSGLDPHQTPRDCLIEIVFVNFFRYIDTYWCFGNTVDFYKY